jgi:hypothetical protein
MGCEEDDFQVAEKARYKLYISRKEEIKSAYFCTRCMQIDTLLATVMLLLYLVFSPI